jgi:hypothetical protein
MRLKYIPYSSKKENIPLKKDEYEYLLVISALKSLRNRLERRNAKKEGFNKPLKKWNLQEIEDFYIKGNLVPVQEK